MKKNDLLLEKYLNEKRTSFKTKGVMNFRIGQFEKLEPSGTDFKIGVTLAINTLKEAIGGIKANLKDFDEKFQRKVIMQALKKLGV